MAGSLLVLAPHQDDELLHCTGTLWRAAKQKKQICVCFVTNGEFDEEALAATRIKESQNALSVLGVPEDSIVFLGYADTGMPKEESFLYRLYHSEPNTLLSSRWGRCETWVPEGKKEFRYMRNRKHSPYTRRAFLQDLVDLLQVKQPDEIYVTAPGDLHGDHGALGQFTKEAVAIVQKNTPDWQPKGYWYLVHTLYEDKWPPRAGSTFTKPEDCEKLGLDWNRREIRLLPTEITAQEKHKLLLGYQSQHPHAYGDFLLSFAKDEELLFPWKGKFK